MIDKTIIDRLVKISKAVRAWFCPDPASFFQVVDNTDKKPPAVFASGPADVGTGGEYYSVKDPSRVTIQAPL